MEIITFMVLEDDVVFSDKLVKFIERKLSTELNIECKVITANSLHAALETKAKFQMDVHVVDIDLIGPGNGFNYITSVAEQYPEDEPVLPIVVISSHGEDYYKLKALQKRVIGYIEKSEYSDDLAMSNFKRVLKMVRLVHEKMVTFTRPGETRVYKEKNVWTIRTIPGKSKKMLVTIFNEDSGEVIEEEFSLKKSLLEVPELFSDPRSMVRCHKSHLVNPYVVKGQQGDKLLLPYEIKVPIGAEYIDNVFC